jgi:leucine dehydrogenase
VSSIGKGECMKVFDEISNKDHEQIIYCNDKYSGLKAIIAIHNTVLGPALGGCRMWNYQNESEALQDVLKLSRGMTYKAAISGLNLGGGKAVIIGDSKSMKSESLFRAFGRFVQSLSGRYITAEDVGTTVVDMEWIRQETDFVTGIPRAFGGSGDPSPVTALGVYHGMRAALHEVFGTDDFAGRTIAIQGVGHVGFYLIKHLLAAKAKIIATDIDVEAIKRVKEAYEGVTFVPVNEIYDVNCDIFAPCALGGAINSNSIPRLNCKIVAGCANNVLQYEEADQNLLAMRNILYTPDFVISAGGLINVYSEINGYNRKYALSQVAGIFDIVRKIFEISSKKGISSLKAANEIAESRIESIAHLKRNRQGLNLQKRGRGLL